MELKGGAMLTYQDFLAAGEGERERMNFVLSAIQDHKRSEQYKTAESADAYFKHKNATITAYQKVLITMSGAAVPDNISANYKLSCGYFPYFIQQETQYLLGNGVSWSKSQTESKLGL